MYDCHIQNVLARQQSLKGYGKKKELDTVKRCTQQEQPLQRETTFLCLELSRPTTVTDVEQHDGHLRQ